MILPLFISKMAIRGTNSSALQRAHKLWLLMGFIALVFIDFHEFHHLIAVILDNNPHIQ